MKRELYNKVVENEQDHWWFKARRSIIKQGLKSFIDNNKNNEILEISCGSGGNLEMLSKFGNLSATEMDPFVRKIAQKRNICPVYYGKLPYELPNKKDIDIICLFDVLEHIEEDEKSLLEIKKHLKKGGLIIITVPALMSLWSYHDVINNHKRRYLKSQLKSLLFKTGFTSIYITYFNFFLFPFIFFIRFFNKLRKNINMDIQKPVSIINFILYKIFSFEKKFIPHFSFPIGVSLLVIAKKD